MRARSAVDDSGQRHQHHLNPSVSETNYGKTRRMAGEMARFRMGECARSAQWALPKFAHEPRGAGRWFPQAVSSLSEREEERRRERSVPGGPRVRIARAAGHGWQRPTTPVGRRGAGCSVEPRPRLVRAESSVSLRCYVAGSSVSLRCYVAGSSVPPHGSWHYGEAYTREAPSGKPHSSTQPPAGGSWARRARCARPGRLDHDLWSPDPGESHAARTGHGTVPAGRTVLRRLRHAGRSAAHLPQPARWAGQHGVQRAAGAAGACESAVGRVPSATHAQAMTLCAPTSQQVVSAERAGEGQTAPREASTGAKGAPRKGAATRVSCSQPIGWFDYCIDYDAIGNTPVFGFALLAQCAHVRIQCRVVMSNAATKWAKGMAAREQARQQQLAPGMAEAQDLQNARAAKEKEKEQQADLSKKRQLARKRQEAKEMQEVDEGLERLTLDTKGALEANKLARDHNILLNIQKATARGATGQTFNREAAMGMVYALSSAELCGEDHRVQATQHHMQGSTLAGNAPKVLLLQLASGNKVMPRALASTMASEYPGTEVVADRVRCFGSDGQMKAPDYKGPKTQIKQIFETTFLMPIISISDDMQTTIEQRQNLRIGLNEYRAHVISGDASLLIPMEIAPGSAALMHMLITSMAVMGKSMLQMEAALLHLIRTGMPEEYSSRVVDLFIEREGIPDLRGGQLRSASSPQEPLSTEAIKGARYAFAKNALGATDDLCGLPKIYLIATSADAAVEIRGGGWHSTLPIAMPGGQQIEIGPPRAAQLNPDQFSKDAVRENLTAQVREAIQAPQEWVQRQIKQAEEGMAMEPDVASMRFRHFTLGRLADPAASFVHPDANNIIQEAQKKMSRLKELMLKSKSTLDGRAAWQKVADMLREVGQELKAVDVTVTPVTMSLQDKVDWRQLLQLRRGPSGPKVPPISQVEKSVKFITSQAKLPLAGLTLVLTPAKTGNAAELFCPGIKGNGETISFAQLWSTEVPKLRGMHGPQNNLKIPFDINGVRTNLLVKMRQADETPAEQDQDIGKEIRQAILEKSKEGGAIFVPVADTTFTKPITEWPVADAQLTHDARHPNFITLQSITREQWGAKLLPTLKGMVEAKEIIPAISSSQADKDTVAYMRPNFASYVDAAVRIHNAENMTDWWKTITYGTDITQHVLDVLQAPFTRAVMQEALTGLWVSKDMVMEGHQDQAGAAAPEAMDVDHAPRGLQTVFAKHPFSNSSLAAQTVTALAQQGKLIIAEVQGSGIILVHPQQKDLAPLLRDNEEAAKPGMRLQYDAITSDAVVDQLSQLIAKAIGDTDNQFMWMLARQAAIAEVTPQDCPAEHQRAMIGQIYPTVQDLLADQTIWSTRGTIFSRAINAMITRVDIQAIPVEQTLEGMSGLAVIGPKPGLTWQDTFGETDMVQEIYLNQGVKLGDNRALAAALNRLRETHMVQQVGKALASPRVLLGVQVTEEGALMVLDASPIGRPVNLDIAGMLKCKTEQDVIQVVNTTQRILKRGSKAKVLACVNGILILPTTHRLVEQEGLPGRAETWNPRQQDLADLEGLSWADIDEEEEERAKQQQSATGSDPRHGAANSSGNGEAMQVDATFTNMIKQLDSMKRSREETIDTIIAPESAASNVSFNSNFAAGNAIHDNGEEWAILEPDKLQEPITITLHLSEPWLIKALAIAHRTDVRYPAFKQCYVQTPSEQFPTNELTFTQDRGVQSAMLQVPFTSQEVQVLFSQEEVFAGEGTPGLRGIMLLGCKPSDSPASQSGKRQAR